MSHYLKIKKVLTFCTIVLGALANTDCGQPVKFTPGTLNQGQSCGTGGLGLATENLRIMVMVDNSDSTNTTDPNKTHRVTVLQNFLQNYGSKTNFSYSYGWFAPQAYEWDMSLNPGAFVSSPVAPFGNANALSNALSAFKSLGTQNGTAYMQAFGGIQTAIDAVAQPHDGWNYVVIFMSDGQPTDLGSITDQPTAIKGLVDTLFADVAAKGALITLTSVYFGAESDAQSISNLQVMAQEGNGQFVDTNTNSDVQINDIVNVPCN